MHEDSLRSIATCTCTCQLYVYSNRSEMYELQSTWAYCSGLLEQGREWAPTRTARQVLVTQHWIETKCNRFSR